MSGDRRELHLVRDASTGDAPFLVRILAAGDVSTAIGGVMAATHYGGGLCHFGH
ncbi:hypothetical protein C8A03DRAFT_34318 [Achaetomium macrosporum]|uniref:Uncharacterized protein n=1 Tax=Achaetomium macrosporum TaxID=79813 RepID=A0AAN7CB17_9PEZI|nr:hypothetical protein C8A03DRAFT_34318 [Achaetomium macrosporum]